jgi:hypothetical protein
MAKKNNAPNYRGLQKEQCCDTCVNFGWDDSGNSEECFKYKIKYVLGDNIEYHMICDSYVMKG